MSGEVLVDEETESLIARQLTAGRYATPADVLRAAMRLLDSRDQRLAMLDAAVARGLADAEAGRVDDLDDVICELMEELRD